MRRGSRNIIIAATILIVAGVGVLLRGPLLDALAAGQSVVAGWIIAWPALGAVLYVAIVAVGKVTPFPGGLLLMASGGFFFGPVLGALLGAFGSALSAVLVALIGRALLRDAILRRWGRYLEPYADPIKEDGFNYILAARLFPVVPAWLVNLVPVVFAIPLRAVLLATFLGLLPVAFILASLGQQVSDLSQMDDVAAQSVLTPGLVLPLGALALLSLGPVIVKLIRRRRRLAREAAMGAKGRDKHTPGV